MRFRTLLVSVILTARVLAGQSAVSPHTPNFRADSDLVIMPVSVVDRHGHAVFDVGADAFVVAEHGVSQQVLSVSQWDVPASIGLIFDASGSMKKNIPTAEAGVRMLIADTTLGDESLLIRFSDSPQLDVDFTEDLNELPNKLLSASARGATALFDAIYVGLHQMRRARTSHKVLVVITDCGENHSRYSFSELLSVARESDVQIYVLALMGSGSYRDQNRGHSKLDRPANETGGRLLTVYRNVQMPLQIATLNSLIRSQLLIAYRPRPSSRDGKWHPVRVRLRLSWKDYKVYAGTGYYAPES